jgi:DNA-directed RNA polymerase delta subunit
MSEKTTTVDVRDSVKKVFTTIERDREREIIARRFGLYDRRETLEQIGELLGITRERVRQLEKAILSRLKTLAQDGKLPGIDNVEKIFIRYLHDQGRVSTIAKLAEVIDGNDDDKTKAHVALLTTISPGLIIIDENDHYRHGVAIAQYHDQKKVQSLVKSVVAEIKTVGEPVSIEELHARMHFEHPSYIEALASLSKELATLGGKWGLIRWPLVNPKNIRDKIYVVLKDKNKPMHFSEISNEIKNSTFKRRDVTTQAIHNELIKDKRFILIGRGIYALKEWGYKQGTVADVIADVLKKSGKPLHRDEIVKRVLKSRRVKETTILLNLQGNPQFKRVAKATYDIKV